MASVSLILSLRVAVSVVSPELAEPDRDAYVKREREIRTWRSACSLVMPVQTPNSSSSDLASFTSAVSKPSVNQP
jgi:hypothetical protein